MINLDIKDKDGKIALDRTESPVIRELLKQAGAKL